MHPFLLSTPAQLVIWLSVLAVLVALGGYIVGRLRGQSDDERLSANDLLTNFRELRDQGGIEEAEFRNIKTVLGVKLQQELNVSVDDGSRKSESPGGAGFNQDSEDRGPAANS